MRFDQAHGLLAAHIAALPLIFLLGRGNGEQLHTTTGIPILSPRARERSLSRTDMAKAGGAVGAVREHACECFLFQAVQMARRAENQERRQNMKQLALNFHRQERFKENDCMQSHSIIPWLGSRTRSKSSPSPRSLCCLLWIRGVLGCAQM